MQGIGEGNLISTACNNVEEILQEMYPYAKERCRIGAGNLEFPVVRLGQVNVK